MSPAWRSSSDSPSETRAAGPRTLVTASRRLVRRDAHRRRSSAEIAHALAWSPQRRSPCSRAQKPIAVTSDSSLARLWHVSGTCLTPDMSEAGRLSSRRCAFARQPDATPATAQRRLSWTIASARRRRSRGTRRGTPRSDAATRGSDRATRARGGCTAPSVGRGARPRRPAGAGRSRGSTCRRTPSAARDRRRRPASRRPCRGWASTCCHAVGLRRPTASAPSRAARPSSPSRAA